MWTSNGDYIICFMEYQIAKNELNILTASDKIDLSIFYFYLGEKRVDKNFSAIARTYLKEAINSVVLSDPKELAMFGLKINFILKKGFAKGNVNEILEDFDNTLYKYCQTSDSDEYILQADLWCLLYFGERLNSQSLKKDDDFIFQNLCIKMINLCYAKLQKIPNYEHKIFDIENALPFFLFTISRIMKLNFYNIRIEKILIEISPIILSYVPLLNVNKLHRIWAMNSVNNVKKIKGWGKHILLLKEHLNLSIICINELKNRQIYFQDGALGVYWISKSLMDIFDDKEISEFQNALIQKMKKSEVWDLVEGNVAYKNSHVGLFNGIAGVRLLLEKVSYED